MKEYKILDYGILRLEDYYGNDLTIVNAARQSFNQKSEIIAERDKGLINYLVREGHGTPLEMVDFRFTVRAPLSVIQELLRHRISSFNQQSARYTKLSPVFYIPEEIAVRSQVGKPGLYKFEPMARNEAITTQNIMNRTYETCWRAYEQLLEEGVAKELARNVLPVGIYSQLTWKINLRSLLNFISLRSADSAMYEIREYSKKIEEIIKSIVPVTYEAFITNGRKAP